VIHNGWGVGETHWGCLAGRARLRGDWLVALPDAFDSARAMAIGTAGYTAMLCVLALERHGVQPGDGEVLVTGASGGVGSVATALLAKLGFRVVASSGKADAHGYLRSLGAHAVIDRAELAAAGKPMQKERWAAVVDSVGSQTLASALAQTRYGGTVAACGLVSAVRQARQHVRPAAPDEARRVRVQFCVFNDHLFPLCLSGFVGCDDSIAHSREAQQFRFTACVARCRAFDQQGHKPAPCRGSVDIFH